MPGGAKVPLAALPPQVPTFFHEVSAHYGVAMRTVGGEPGGAAQPSRSRWWAAQHPSGEWPTVSTARAYVEVLGVFGAFFAASVAAAGFVVAGSTLPSNVAGWPIAIPSSIDQVAVTALAVGVPVLLAGRRGLGPRDLGFGVRQLATPGAGIRMAAWAVLALVVGSVITTRLASGHLPLGRLTYPALTVNLFHALQAGFLEETVVLALVVTMLEQARRPLPEIVVVAVVLRASYHVYYGPGVLGVLIWAPTFVWLYRRFRTIVPLIVVHSAWDVLAVLSARWHGVAALLFLLVLALFVTGPITWRVDRANARRSVPSGWQDSPWPPGRSHAPAEGAPGRLPPPGWYPDPAGAPRWRWWTGAQWWWQPAPASPDRPAAGAEETSPSGSWDAPEPPNR